MIASPPEESAQLVVIMKLLPVPEQPEKEKMLNWLKRASNGLSTRLFLPTKTLTRKTVRMAESYEAQLKEF